MRKYIRHPSSIPLHFRIDEGFQAITKQIKDVSVGGLCFSTDQTIEPGTKIHIRIPLSFYTSDPDPDPLQHQEQEHDIDTFDAEGYIAWCQQEVDGYAVGVQFDDQSTQFGVRMVEQICHIEQYRSGVLEGEGRELGKEEAAKEWVEKFAADFPD